MSNRRLAVVNPLSHSSVPPEKSDLNRSLEKPSEFFTISVQNVSDTKEPAKAVSCNVHAPETLGNNLTVSDIPAGVSKRFTCVAVSTSRGDDGINYNQVSCEQPPSPFAPSETTLSMTSDLTPLLKSRRLQTNDKQNPTAIGQSDSMQSTPSNRKRAVDVTNESPASVRLHQHAPDHTNDLGPVSAHLKNTGSLDLTRTRLAQAIHDFHDPSAPNALSFHKGDRITVMCEHSTSKPDRQVAYRGFLTARGPQPIGLVPGWAIAFLPTDNNPSTSLNSQTPRTKVDFAVQTDFPAADFGDEYFSETDDDDGEEEESGSSEAEAGNVNRAVPQNAVSSPNTLSFPARTHLMSSSVELKPSRATGSPTRTATTTTGSTALGMSSKLPKSSVGVVIPVDHSMNRGMMMVNVNAGATTVMTPSWDTTTKRHSAASLDSGRDSTYAGSSEGSGGAQPAPPPISAVLRSPQTPFDRSPLYLNTSPSKLNPNSTEHVSVMNCSYPGTAYTRNNTLIASRTPITGVNSPSDLNETNLSRGSSESFNEASPRFNYPYGCGSLVTPSAVTCLQSHLAGSQYNHHHHHHYHHSNSSHQHHRQVGNTSGRPFAPDPGSVYAPSPMIPGVEYRPTYPGALTASHPLTQQKRLSYRPTDFHETSSYRSDSDRDPLVQWLHSIGLSRLEEPLTTAGFDLWTLCRTTPEELNACGITNPADRQALRMELNRLQLPDHLPDQLPLKVYDWLAQLNLAVYWPFLREQGLCTFEQIAKLTWEDLEEVGISKLGHQKKLLLAINRLTRLIACPSGSAKAPCPAGTVTDAGGFHYPMPLSPPSLYASPHCSSTSISSPVVLHDTDSLCSILPPSLLSADDTSNPNTGLSIADPFALKELAEAENLSDSQSFPSPPSAFQDPIPPPMDDNPIPQPPPPPPPSPPPPLITFEIDATSPQTDATPAVSSTATASLPPPVPLRRSSITDMADAMHCPSGTEHTVYHGFKSSLRLRYPRLGRRVQSILSPHLAPDMGSELDPDAWTSLTRRSSSPSLFPLKADRMTATKEQLTKWSSGQLATPQLCFPPNFQAPLDPELQDMSDIRAMLDALSEHLTSATQL